MLMPPPRGYSACFMRAAWQPRVRDVCVINTSLISFNLLAWSQDLL